VIRFRFGAEDLLRTRFAVSPLFELFSSVEVLKDPGAHSMHLPWVRRARRAVAGLDLELLEALGPGEHGYAPDFTSPPPRSPIPDVEAELARVRETDAGRVATELGWRYADGAVPPVVRPLLDEPAAGLDALVGLMRAYWQAAIEPWWPAIRATLDADIRHRARRLTEAGPLAVFEDLHPEVEWHDDTLSVGRPYDADVDLGGRGLVLIPCAFQWPRAGAMFDPPWQPSLLYAPRGIALLWEPPEAGDAPAADALGPLLGERRARILLTLREPASTTELAARLEASPAGISEHLRVLRRAGLISGRRDGRSVRYARTSAGDALAGSATARPRPS
jgi:DNA-binding transcriptional ArsR family regulator